MQACATGPIKCLVTWSAGAGIPLEQAETYRPGMKLGLEKYTLENGEIVEPWLLAR